MKKSGLFKIILILILVVSAITWLVPASYYSGSEIAELGMNRIGFFDFFNLTIALHCKSSRTIVTFSNNYKIRSIPVIKTMMNFSF